MDNEYPITKKKALEYQTGVLFIPYGEEEIQNSEYQNREDIRIVVFPNTIKTICDACMNGNWIESSFVGCGKNINNLKKILKDVTIFK